MPSISFYSQNVKQHKVIIVSAFKWQFLDLIDQAFSLQQFSQVIKEQNVHKQLTTMFVS